MPRGTAIRRYAIPAAIAVATVAGFAIVARRTAGDAVSAAASPNWPLLAAAFAIGAVVQPLRALAWRQTLGTGVGFRAIYAASAIGSFLDTVLPGRLGEAAKVGVLRAASAERWPGLPRAGGSLLATHLTEAIAFCVVGAAAGAFLPVPGWVRGAMLGSVVLAGGGLVVAATLHRRLGRRLPAWADGFLAAAGAPKPVLLRTLAILLGTWAVRWIGVALTLNALGVHAGLGTALVYMTVTGLANTAPLLPGNAGVYQGAAVGALAMVGHAGAAAVAASVIMPLMATAITAAAALVALALYGRRFAELPRAAFRVRR
ncbi:MAG TPA: lysylphosphatidylglycerol synthase transmembrane domain-containing protein [Gaiellaceae bacterium]|nr:lysylphosphatidylglycerol synthase transmembrane domain-containing protein [Gaiellaceae bacterium]